jgi:hypothetical protein
MKFTKNTIMLDIAKRMGDNELKLYKYRGWSAFQNTLATLAADRTAWERQEISPLLKTVPINMHFADAAFAFSLPSDAIAFTDVWIDPSVPNAWGGILKRIDEVDAQRASTGEIAFMPAGNEIFWYLVGDKFRFILSRDMYVKPDPEAQTVAVSGALSLEYVADPATLDFETTVGGLAELGISPYTKHFEPIAGVLPDLISWFGFSSRFLYRCINDSIAILVAENQVARPEAKAIDIETNPPEMGAV